MIEDILYKVADAIDRHAYAFVFAIAVAVIIAIVLFANTNLISQSCIPVEAGCVTRFG